MTISTTDQEMVVEPQASEVVLSVQGVSKKFCRDLKRSLFYGVQDIATELVAIRGENEKLRSGEFWALRDVSFQLRRGETLGLVGPNGSGKTTMLRIISGLIRLDTGSVEVKGRIAPLIALGAGFNPILTGWENIYVNMSILGLSKQEIDERFQDVIDFAGIGDAINAPVRSYSSGMAARLGFASAIHTDPDILLIDEVLAVGDSRFRGRCFQKLHELRQKGTSFIFVSHDPHSILTVCNSAVYLQRGKLIGVGDTASVMSQYEKDLFLDEAEKSSVPISALKKRETIGLDIRSLFFRNSQGKLIESPVMGEPTYFCIGCNVQERIDNVSITFTINRLAEGGDTVLILNSLNDKDPINFLPGEHEIQLQMPYLGLRLGVYTMDVFVKKDKLCHLDCVEFFRFTVNGGKESISRCMFYQPRTWRVISGKNSSVGLREHA